MIMTFSVCHTFLLLWGDSGNCGGGEACRCTRSNSGLWGGRVRQGDEEQGKFSYWQLCEKTILLFSDVASCWSIGYDCQSSKEKAVPQARQKIRNKRWKITNVGCHDCFQLCLSNGCAEPYLLYSFRKTLPTFYSELKCFPRGNIESS